MPPATFIAAIAPTFSIDPTTGNTVAAMLTPRTTQPGDTLLILVASSDASSGTVDTGKLAAGWSVIGRFVSVDSQILTVLRRIATPTEPPSHTVATVGAAIAGVMLLVYRDLDTNAPLIEGSALSFVGSAAATCPSRTLAAYSDLYIGVVFAATPASTAATPIIAPSGTVQRFDAAQAPQGSACRLEVFDLLPELAAPTAALFPLLQLARTGLSASILLRAAPALLAPSITPDIPGAIGFVTVGV